jgi:ribonuclease P protein component
MPNQGLPKQARLKSRISLEAIFAAGKSFTVFPIKVFYRIIPAENEKMPVQAGVGVSSRNFKKAADRNRIKRLLRETYRTQQELLTIPKEQKLEVFFLFLAKELPVFDELKAQMKISLERINEKLNKQKMSG